MINVRALTQLVTDNADPRLYPRWFITTPNGSLLAYTSPTDIRGLRDQVGLVTAIWKEQLVAHSSKHHKRTPSTASNHSSNIHTITLEFDSRNVLIRELQRDVLLVLEGGVPPGRAKPLVMTVEGKDDPRYPEIGGTVDALQSKATGHATTTELDQRKDSDLGTISPTAKSTISVSSTIRRQHVLDMHRRKLDAMTETIREEFARSKFAMPDDPDDRIF